MNINWHETPLSLALSRINSKQICYFEELIRSHEMVASFKREANKTQFTCVLYKYSISKSRFETNKNVICEKKSWKPNKFFNDTPKLMIFTTLSCEWTWFKCQMLFIIPRSLNISAHSFSPMTSKCSKSIFSQLPQSMSKKNCHLRRIYVIVAAFYRSVSYKNVTH